MILSIEGIDGAGKNTLVSALNEQLAGESGISEIQVISFPRYAESIHAQLAQQALHGDMGDLTDSVYAMATLFALDRHGIVEKLCSFHRRGDCLLILDRYVASNAAYSAARILTDGGTKDQAEKVIEWVAELEFGQLGLPQPDLQVLLDTSPELAAKRAMSRESADASRARDRYERDGGLQKRTYAGYLELAQKQWAGPWLVTSSAEKIMEALRDLPDQEG